MGGGNHLYRQVKAEDLGNFRRYQPAKGGEDIGVVALALLKQLGLIHLIIEQMFVAVVLAEGVIAEQHGVAGQVGHHAVGPVQHWRFDKDQLFAVADIQRIASFHHMEIPFRVVMVTVNRVDSVMGTVDWRIGDMRHQLRQRARVILFGVVNDDVVDHRQIDLAAQVLHELAAEFVIDGINQHVFALADQVAVIAAALQRFVFGAVKITNFPVALSNPVNVVFYMNRHDRNPVQFLNVIHGYIKRRASFLSF